VYILPKDVRRSMLKMMFDQEKCTTFLFFDVVFSAVEMFRFFPVDELKQQFPLPEVF